MQQEWTTKLMNDSSFTDPIPSNQDGLCKTCSLSEKLQKSQKRDNESVG